MLHMRCEDGNPGDARGVCRIGSGQKYFVYLIRKTRQENRKSRLTRAHQRFTSGLDRPASGPRPTTVGMTLVGLHASLVVLLELALPCCIAIVSLPFLAFKLTSPGLIAPQQHEAALRNPFESKSDADGPCE